MRNAFADEITKLASQNDKIVLLSGDIGNRLFNTYKEKCGDRFFNCGVAEANMTGVAAGLALSGMRPLTYTITPFLTTRCLEQIKLDVCYHNLPVVIVGVGSGLSYAGLGATHHSFEDLSLLRTFPNMTVVAPADVWEVRAALRAAFNHNGPVYIRIGKKNEPVIHNDFPDFKFGKVIPIINGNDVCIISTGNMMPTAIAAAEKLKENKVSAHVVSMHTIKPLDDDFLKTAFNKFSEILTIEEHSLIGGLGSAIAEWLIDNKIKTADKLIRLGIKDEFLHEAGGQNFAREQLGLTADNIVKRLTTEGH